MFGLLTLSIGTSITIEDSKSKVNIKEPCIRVNIRELNKFSSTKCLPYIY